MKILFVYPSFERHAQSNPELLEFVPAEEYVGPPSLGIASVAACTPEGFEVAFTDDRLTPVGNDPPEADLYALSFFTPAASRAFEIADGLRALGKKVIAGGVFPTMMPEECARHFDAVVIGEGEAVWPEVCRDAANELAGQRKREIDELARLPDEVKESDVFDRRALRGWGLDA